MSLEQGIHPEKAVSLADIVVRAYLNANPVMNMGEWVMNTFYPDVALASLVNGRNFYCVKRTSDARTYLIGMLISGSLPASPLQNPLNYSAKSELMKRVS